MDPTMTGDVAEWDDPAQVPPVEPQLVFGSVGEFVREKLRYAYARRVGPHGSSRWDAG